MDIRILMRLLGLFFGSLSAWFWWRSATVKIPKEVPFEMLFEPVEVFAGPDHDQPYVTTRGAIEDLSPIVLAYREQARLNKIAAALTAVTVVLQAVTVFVGG